MVAVCRCRSCGQRFDSDDIPLGNPLGEPCTPKHLGPFDPIPNQQAFKGPSESSAVVKMLARIQLNEGFREGPSHAIVTTEAEWVEHLKSNGKLVEDKGLMNVVDIESLKLGKVDSSAVHAKTRSTGTGIYKLETDLWAIIQKHQAPPNTNEADACNEGGDFESAPGTQSRFCSIIAALKETTFINWTSRVEDRHKQASFNLRKPDIPSYIAEADCAGPFAITTFGDIKPSVNSDDTEFTPAQFGHVLDMSRELMEKQSWRTTLFTYLTDTRRFQFFKTARCADGSFQYSVSGLMHGETAWAYWIALHELSVEDIGYTPLGLANIRLKRVLASSSKSVVFRAAASTAKVKDTTDPDEEEGDSSADYAVKVILSETSAAVTAAVQREREHTSKVSATVATFRSANPDVAIASVFPLLAGAEETCAFRDAVCPVIVLKGVGKPVQPARHGEVVLGAHVAKLVRLLQVVHEQLRLVHRDIKPDNIVITDSDVYLLDWGSAAKVLKKTSYVATPGFRVSQPVWKGPTLQHEPKPADDLLQLARSAYCMLFNRPPPAPILCDTFESENAEWAERLAPQVWQEILAASLARQYDALIGLYNALK